jgi:hypothetical protein
VQGKSSPCATRSSKRSGRALPFAWSPNQSGWDSQQGGLHLRPRPRACALIPKKQTRKKAGRGTAACEARLPFIRRAFRSVFSHAAHCSRREGGPHPIGVVRIWLERHWLCIRARLQPCRNLPKIIWPLGPEGKLGSNNDRTSAAKSRLLQGILRHG